MPTLPHELAAFPYLLDAQPAPVRDAFHYCLCLLMVEAGKMRLVEKVPGEPVLAGGPGTGTVWVFETPVEDRSKTVWLTQI